MGAAQTVLASWAKAGERMHAESGCGLGGASACSQDHYPSVGSLDVNDTIDDQLVSYRTIRSR